MNKLPLSALRVSDIERCPVWEMVDDAHASDVFVKPVDQLPANVMKGRLVGTQIALADGSKLWALLGNIAPNDAVSCKHFMTVSVHNNGKWFDLARYHDVDFARRDAAALAQFLGKPVSDVFPITYDISNAVAGSPDVLVGRIEKSPDVRLSDKELIELSLKRY